MSTTGSFETYATANAGEFQPVLEMTLKVAGPQGDDPPPWYTGGLSLNLSSGITSARGKAYSPIVLEWGDMMRGFDAFASSLQPFEATVLLHDENDNVRLALESGGNQRGSPATIYYVLPDNSTDYQVLFTGILERWGYRSGHLVELTLRTDDALLRKYIP